MERDEQIQKLEAQIEKLRKPMAKTYGKWLDATADWAAAFWNAEAKRIVTEQADITASKGQSGVAELRADIATLTSTARGLVEHAVSDNLSGYFPHLKTDMTEPPRHWENVPPPRFEPRTLFGRGTARGVGPFMDTMGSCVRQVNSALKDHGYCPKTAVGYEDWSPEMRNAISEYGDLDEKHQRLTYNLAVLRREKAQGEAADLWDAAG
jgi:hypothetical protein